MHWCRWEYGINIVLVREVLISTVFPSPVSIAEYLVICSGPSDCIQCALHHVITLCKKWLQVNDNPELLYYGMTTWNNTEKMIAARLLPAIADTRQLLSDKRPMYEMRLRS